MTSEKGILHHHHPCITSLVHNVVLYFIELRKKKRILSQGTKKNVVNQASCFSFFYHMMTLVVVHTRVI